VLLKTLSQLAVSHPLVRRQVGRIRNVVSATGSFRIRHIAMVRKLTSPALLALLHGKSIQRLLIAVSPTVRLLRRSIGRVRSVVSATSSIRIRQIGHIRIVVSAAVASRIRQINLTRTAISAILLSLLHLKTSSYVPSVLRTIHVLYESRTSALVVDNRLATVPLESRLFSVTGE